MRELRSDPGLVAYCGLYCGACRRYLSEKCPGCRENAKATWCKIRTCCTEDAIASCAECRKFSRVEECKQFNGLVARFFGVVFRSDRPACIEQIRRLGLAAHADEMTRLRRQSIRR